MASITLQKLLERGEESIEYSKKAWVFFLFPTLFFRADVIRAISEVSVMQFGASTHFPLMIQSHGHSQDFHTIHLMIQSLSHS